MLRRSSIVAAVFLVLAITLTFIQTNNARAAADDPKGAVRLLATVPVPGTLQPLRAFDISWLDAATQLYFLADRSNASVDVVDAKTNQFVTNIQAGFAGVAFRLTVPPPVPMLIRMELNEASAKGCPFTVVVEPA